MNEEILMVAESVSNEKDLPKDTIFEAIELALASAAKKRYDNDVDIKVNIDRDTGDFETFRCWTAVDFEEYESSDIHILADSDLADEKGLKEGDIDKEQIENPEFGRIAAQAAKQVIVQKVRDAERLEIIKKFRPYIGTLVNGTVKKVTREFIIVDLGDNAEASLSRRDLVQGEIYRIGDRIKGILGETERENRGSQLVLSRSANEMVVELFKLEVPEIAEEVIQIRAVARDSGARTKIAVKTNDVRIDPVGACVGMRGSRVQAVSNELGSERIDIVVWDDDPAKLLINTLSPAEVTSIVLDEENRSMEVKVKDENLALAIGRNGQNIRLASELIGWQIQIGGENDDLSIDDSPENVLIKFMGVDADLAQKLIENGFDSVQKISESSVEDLESIEEIDSEISEVLIERSEAALLELALSDIENEELKDNSLESLELLNEDFIEKLKSSNITSKEELADLASDELMPILEISEDRAGEIIMAARAQWFD